MSLGLLSLRISSRHVSRISMSFWQSSENEKTGGQALRVSCCVQGIVRGKEQKVMHVRTGVSIVQNMLEAAIPPSEVLVRYLNSVAIPAPLSSIYLGERVRS